MVLEYVVFSKLSHGIIFLVELVQELPSKHFKKKTSFSLVCINVVLDGLVFHERSKIDSDVCQHLIISKFSQLWSSCLPLLMLLSGKMLNNFGLECE